MDLVAVRTFVAVADTGQFQDAAAELDVTQQAVSKRIASLEAELGVRLFSRTARGAEPTIDGQAFLPHARAVLEAVDRATESVRPGRRALRVDVVNRRNATAGLLKDFHDKHPDVELDVVALKGSEEAMTAVGDGVIDAAFCTLRVPVPEGVASMPTPDEPHQLLVGPAHPFASERSVTVAQLHGYRIWVPGITISPDAAAYYAELVASFGLKIDGAGPLFGMEHLLDMVSESESLATFTAPGMRLMWTLQHDLRRIAIRGPELIFPFSFIWRTDNQHPSLAALRSHLASLPQRAPAGDRWLPSWSCCSERWPSDDPSR